LRAQVRESAQRIWDAAAPVERHLFFSCWGVSVSGLKVYRGDLTIDGVSCDGMLLVPMLDADRKIQNLAFISLIGNRHYLSKDQVLGTYFGIGPRSDPILIAEGFLRGVRAHQATENAVAVAFTAANIPNVAMIMRHRHRYARIKVIARDGSLENADFDAHFAGSAAGFEGTPEVAGESSAERATGIPTTQPTSSERRQDPKVGCTLLEPTTTGARNLLEWVKRKGLTAFTRSQVLQRGPVSVRKAVAGENRTANAGRKRVAAYRRWSLLSRGPRSASRASKCEPQARFVPFC
jgi:hypothetical protein